VALTGPSGSGKSSILKAINRLIDIYSGDILVQGSSVKDYSLFDLRRKVAYMFQRGLLFPHLSVFDNIALPISDKVKGHELKDRVSQLLDDCELDPILYGSRMPRSLSGGELQRASLALTLVHRPKLLMLDEPFTGLDNETKTQLIDFLTRLRSKFGMTILLVTHDSHEADAMTDRELSIIGGKLS
jgi:osmoprotectant transport system ATP-binding protein